VRELTLSPTPPYSLAQSAWGSNPCRRFVDGVLETVFCVSGEPTRACVWQRSGGEICVRLDGGTSDDAVEHLRFILAMDEDHRPFLDLAREDRLLGDLVAGRRGMRPLRTSTVAHALVQAIAGQLITAKEARQIERRIVALVSRTFTGLALPPTAADLRTLSAAELVRCGLAPRRAAALARIVRTFDLERLRSVDTATAVARIRRERTLGPWSAGVISVYGLGRYEHGLVGDLSLMRLCDNLLSRPATPDDTAKLLARYGEWAGLAGIHLMNHPLARRRFMHAA
jgi:3-methyladenine DNA glycosylase/8-oxoguanine DNA glycosylase